MASDGGSDGAPKSSSSTSTSRCRSLTVKKLRDITDNFSEESTWSRHIWECLQGVHDNGEVTAVKVFYNNIAGIGDGQFQSEFANLMSLEHPNIVRLVGYCYETQHKPMIYTGQTIFAEEISKALCFEYMPNGSLQKHLSEESGGLGWQTRYKIIKGTCEGLKYLHEGLEEPFYHLDLKPDNILLDGSMVPKLADFGLSKFFLEQQTMITKSLIGTIGYLPPGYLFQHLISKKLDIFSLGVVMIKIIAGPRGLSRSAEMPNLQEFIDQVHENWKNRLQARHHSEPLEAYCLQVKTCTDIALSCMETDRHKRPTIVDIIRRLNETESVIGNLKNDTGTSSTMDIIDKMSTVLNETETPEVLASKSTHCVYYE